MVYVEYFDEEDVNNVCATLVDAPEQVIFIGGNAKKMKKAASQYRKVFEARGITTRIVCLSVNVNHLDDIVHLLSNIVESNTDENGKCSCVFDLTGGRDLVLVAMGIVYKIYAEREIQMQRFNISGGRVIDCDADGRKFSACVPQLTAEECIMIHGGAIVYADQKTGGTRKWDNNEGFLEDIDGIWKVCRRDVRRWNSQINLLETANKMKIIENPDDPDYDPLVIEANIASITAHPGRGSEKKLDSFDSVISGLCQNGILTEYSSDGVKLRVRYKNEQVRACLAKVGQALEMKIYSTALKLRDANGKPIYNDVMNGVVIDWDGEIVHPKGSRIKDTENEIDVIMMHGAIPVFVSCKNGNVDTDELYKLCSVADRFGGKYARRVLVANAVDEGAGGDHLRQRAADMDVRLIENVQNMNDEELCRVITNLWRK